MLSFYRDVLGLPMNTTIHPGKGYEPGVNLARFEPGGLPDDAAVELFGSKRLEPSATAPQLHDNSFVPAFKVENVPETYEQVGGRDVEFSKAVGEEDWGWYAYLRDPEGNRLRLANRNLDSRRG